MVDKKTLSIVLVIAIVLIASIAYWATYAPGQQNATQNSTSSLANSLSLSNFSSNLSTPNLAIQNGTLNSSVSQDQNYSILSSGNLIASP